MPTYILLISAGMLTRTPGAAPSQHQAWPLAASGGVEHLQDQGYATQISQGTVTLELQPRWEDGRLMIGIAATTHSGDLSEINLQRQVRLVVEGDSLAPEDTSALRGHHAETVVAFKLARRPQLFTVVIRDVPDEPLRILKWPASTPRP